MNFEFLPGANLSSSPKSVSTSVCGKVILIGEHAVVYGAKAVALPLASMRIHLNLKPVPDVSENFSEESLSLACLLRQMLQQAVEVLGVPPFSYSISGYSNILIGAGLGSSASISIIVIRALNESLALGLNHSEVAQLGNILEKRFHGTPSGLDTSVVAHEKPILFERGQATRELKVQAPKGSDGWPFVVIDSRERASTLDMIEVARPFFVNSREKRVSDFNQMAQTLCSGLEEGDLARVSNIMQQCQVYLEDMGVVTDPLRQILRDCSTGNIPAAKVTGAGGGGCVVALLDPNCYKAQLEYLKGLYSDNVYAFRI